MNKIFITGLPRSGSTLLCQIMSNHPDVFCDGMTSPLFGIIENTRNYLSKDTTYLSRLDQDFDLNYQRTKNLYNSIINGWLENHHNKNFVVDKNRGWLRNLETLILLEPNAKILINIRDLTQIFGSIEKNHKKTLLIGFTDGISQHSSDSRANSLFAESGVIGSPLKFLKDFIFEYSDDLKKRCYFVDYEKLILDTDSTVNSIFDFCGLQTIQLDFENLNKTKQESDSHYGMKWSHKTYSRINDLDYHNINKNIELEIKNRFNWYYELFYKDRK